MRVSLVLAMLVLLTVPAAAQMQSGPSYHLDVARDTEEPVRVGEVQQVLVQVRRTCATEQVMLESEQVQVAMHWAEPALIVAGPRQVTLPEQLCPTERSVSAAVAYEVTLSDQPNATVAMLMARADAPGAFPHWGNQVEASFMLPLEPVQIVPEPVLEEVSEDAPFSAVAALVPLVAAALYRRSRS